ncbi:MAG: sodium:glutamate symporter [Candidatus Latescibacteria bacterium]|nr:sodium:glutamate symporter [Candidatus Latescibacterota bacterium]
MDFSVWALFIDAGLAALLLLGGLLLRARVGPVQRAFLPANVLAGLVGLALGPQGLGLIPFSDSIGRYPGVLIALIFAALPFAAQGGSGKGLRRGVVELCGYSSVFILLQWGGGLLVGLSVLSPIWPDLHPGFGLVLASGFVGGHGTAAAIGQTFARQGWADAGPLAMTAATVGIVGAIVGGMLWVKWGSQRGVTRYVARFTELPGELRTGLVAPDKRNASGQETISPIALDPLVFHFALISAAALGGYYLVQGTEQWMGDYTLPTFCTAFLVALLVRQVLQGLGGFHYVDRRTVVRLGGSFTDMLVVFGIASINLPLLLRYAYPLAALFAFGFILCWVIFRFCGPRVFRELWFEKSLYTWGWVTGVMAMAIALLRIVDPDNDSRVLDDFALAYIVVGLIEGVMVILCPIAVAHGQGWLLALGASAAGLVLLLMAMRRR